MGQMTWQAYVLAGFVAAMAGLNFWAVRIIGKLCDALKASGALLDTNTYAITEAARLLSVYKQREKADQS